MEKEQLLESGGRGVQSGVRWPLLACASPEGGGISALLELSRRSREALGRAPLSRTASRASVQSVHHRPRRLAMRKRQDHGPPSHRVPHGGIPRSIRRAEKNWKSRREQKHTQCTVRQCCDSFTLKSMLNPAHAKRTLTPEVFSYCAGMFASRALLSCAWVNVVLRCCILYCVAPLRFAMYCSALVLRLLWLSHVLGPLLCFPSFTYRCITWCCFA